MSSPGSRPVRRPSLVTRDTSYNFYPLATHNGTLASLIRTRSQQNLVGSYPPAVRNGSEDEETASLSRGLTRDDDEIGRLLMDERRMSQILHGPQARSRNLIGKSNPRYRWERYWKPEDDLKAMNKPL